MTEDISLELFDFDKEGLKEASRKLAALIDADIVRILAE